MIPKRFLHAGTILALATVLFLPAVSQAMETPADLTEDGSTDYVDMVDPYIMSARGRWFFFGTGKRPFGMVNLFPDTRNAGLFRIERDRF